MRRLLWLALAAVVLSSWLLVRIAARPLSPPDWDPRLDALHVSYQPAADCQQGCWRLVSARYEDKGQSGGNHHVWARLLDERGTTVGGQPWSVAWAEGTLSVLSKPAPDWADVPLWACYFPDQGNPGPYRAFAGLDEARSDGIRGMGLPYCWHVNFRLTWQWQPAGLPTPTPHLPGATPSAGPLAVPRIWYPIVIWQPMELPTPTPRPSETPLPTATSTPQPLPFAGEVVQRFPNCGLTQIFGVVHDADGRPLPGTRVRLTWDAPDAPLLYATAGDYIRPETDASGWDFVLAGAPVANTWRVAVVSASGAPLSEDVRVTTVSDCAPESLNVGKVRFQERP